MLDLRSIFDRLVKNKLTDDMFIERRIQFIAQIIQQRNLDVRYQMIKDYQNEATKLLLPEN